MAVRRELNSGGLACALFFFAECVASYYPVQLLLIPCFHFLCRHTILYPCTLQYYTIPYKQYLARSTIHATFSQGPPAKLSLLQKVCPLFVYSIAYKTRGSRGVSRGLKVPGGNVWTQYVELPFTNKTYIINHYGILRYIGSPKKGFWDGQLFTDLILPSPFLRMTAIFNLLINHPERTWGSLYLQNKYTYQNHI